MPKPKRSLAQFLAVKKRDASIAACAICKLSPDVRKQIREATVKGRRHRDILIWLTDELRLKVTQADLRYHTNGKHGSPR